MKNALINYQGTFLTSERRLAIELIVPITPQLFKAFVSGKKRIFLVIKNTYPARTLIIMDLVQWSILNN